MLNRIKKSNSEGFTIIEVMIVLAIAGLIILIVLLAVPALQRNSRNTAIKNDASAIAGGISEFASNNDGGTIGAGSSKAANSTTVVLDNSAITGHTLVNAKVQASDTVTFVTSNGTQTPTPAGHILVDYGYKCNALTGGTGYTVTQSVRATAIVYPIELSGGTLKAACIDS